MSKAEKGRGIDSPALLHKALSYNRLVERIAELETELRIRNKSFDMVYKQAAELRAALRVATACRQCRARGRDSFKCQECAGTGRIELADSAIRREVERQDVVRRIVQLAKFIATRKLGGEIQGHMSALRLALADLEKHDAK